MLRQYYRYMGVVPYYRRRIGYGLTKVFFRTDKLHWIIEIADEGAALIKPNVPINFDFDYPGSVSTEVAGK